MLVATDLTEKSVNAVERALQLKREGAAARMTILHVVEGGLSSKIEERRCAEALLDFQEGKASLAPGDQKDLDFKVLVGEPFATIALEEVSHDTDLIVMGRPGKHGFKELFLGTVTERVIRFSDEPVLVVCERPSGPYKRVLVAMDFSEAASRALAQAYRIATDAEIRIVHAWQSPLSHAFSVGAQAKREEKARATQSLQQEIGRVRERAGLPPGTTDASLVDGSPHVVILSEIEKFEADLLVIGTHTRGRLNAAMVGSLTQEFLTMEPCDVLVARA
jgi:nucleotide-binding universal stress UspA family protein